MAGSCERQYQSPGSAAQLQERPATTCRSHSLPECDITDIGIHGIIERGALGGLVRAVVVDVAPTPWVC
jgi:hypothetical protein